MLSEEGPLNRMTASNRLDALLVIALITGINDAREG